MPLFLQRRPHKPKTFCGRSNATEGNYGVFPIISIPDADMDREEVQSKNVADTAKALLHPGRSDKTV